MDGLQSHTSGGGGVERFPGGWRLSLPAGGRGYALAQLDDYTALPRREFPHRPPLRLSLRARISSADTPGTWGFGLWNDPFSLSLGLGGGARRFPALPNAAWFFFASAENHLSFRDDQPGAGALAACFASPRIPAPLLGAALPLLGAAVWPPAGRLLRRRVGALIRQDTRALNLDPSVPHRYTLEWTEHGVRWQVDGRTVHHSRLSPGGPLGLVLWVDNQYAAWRPDGRLRWGILPLRQAVQLEIENFRLVSV